VWPLDLKFLYELAATMGGTSNPPSLASGVLKSATTTWRN
jgi:hypothetical protein